MALSTRMTTPIRPENQDLIELFARNMDIPSHALCIERSLFTGELTLSVDREYEPVLRAFFRLPSEIQL